MIPLLLLSLFLAEQKVAPRFGPEDGLLAVTVDGKTGFIDVDGRIVIPPTFTIARQFSEGLASAWVDNRVGFIDRTGAFVVSPRFDDAKAFHEGLIEVQVGRLWGFARRNGELAVPARFEDTRWFSEGLAPVQIGGKWGYIDPSGTMVIPPDYGVASPFTNGRAYVSAGRRFITIDPKGNEIPDPTELIPKEQDGKWGYVRPSGEVAIAFRFDSASPFAEGLAAVGVGSLFGFVNTRGELAIPAVYENNTSSHPHAVDTGPPIGSFSEGMVAVYKNGAWLFIDASGREPFPLRFTRVDTAGFRNGIASVLISGTWGYIDRTGRVIWPKP